MVEEKFNISKKEKSKELQENFKELEMIAQRVGSDFGMKIKIGKPGGGSFFNPTENSITLDPEHIKEDKEGAKFVAAHEGAHKAISKHPKEIGLAIDKIRQLYQKTGFGFIQNAIEDPAVNDWFQSKLPGLRKCTQENYDEQFKKEGAVLSSPEIQKIAQRLGYWPKFAKFGSEIIRNWHKGNFSKDLDIDVKKALNKTKKYFEESIKSIPSKDPTDDEVVKKAQKRFKINTEKVWPEVEKLVEKDMENEEMRQQTQDIEKDLEEIEKIKKQIDKIKQKQQSKKGKQGQQKVGSQENQSSFQDQKTKDKNQQSKNTQKNTDQDGVKSGSSQGKSEEDGQISQEQAQKDSGQESSSKINDKIKNKQDKIKEMKDKLKSKGLDDDVLDEIHDKIKQAEKDLDQDLPNDEKPVPIDKLSEKAKEQLKKAFDELEDEEKQKIKEDAKKALDDLEDKMNKEIESKLKQKKPKSHKDQRKTKKSYNKTKKDFQNKEKNREKIRQKLRSKIDSTMSAYEKTRSENMYLIDSLYMRLMKILKPDQISKKEGGYPSGFQPDLQRVMQSDADYNQKMKMWLRESDPENKDYRFWSLIDMSGSMNGAPIKEVYKGFIVVTEALDRIENFNSENMEVHQGITGFSDDVYQYKAYDERMTKQLEKKLSGILSQGGGGTDTIAATKHALEKIFDDPGEDVNFLFTFTDGSPNNPEGLKQLIKETKEQRKEKNIKLGIIWLVEGESSEKDEKELKELKEFFGYDFGMVMTTSEFDKENKEKNFAQRLAKLLETIIKDPDKL